MTNLRLMAIALVFGFASSGAALANCEGGLGRGWGDGKGAGKFQMPAKDKQCLIPFPAFINDAKKTKEFADQVTLRRAPKNGTIGIAAGKGIVYTPTAGFKGQDNFCLRATTEKVKGKSLTGCVTVTIQ